MKAFFYAAVDRAVSENLGAAVVEDCAEEIVFMLAVSVEAGFEGLRAMVVET